MEPNQLRLAERELETAKKAIIRMSKAVSLEEFEDEWRIYLSAIEKSWVKIERICQPFENKFKPWQGKYIKQRKSDSLLKYLVHARHSDQHTVQEMIEPKPAEKHAKIGDQGEDVFIDNLCIGTTGEIIKYIGSHPIEYIFIPQRIELLPVLSSKKWYHPPHKHLDKIIIWPAPITVAELGLEFYQEYLNKVKNKFFKENL